MSLKRKVLSGVKWNFIDTFFLSGLSFIGLVLIARWIGPEEFGLIGILSIFIAIGNSLIDGGLASSLIRTQDVDNNDFSTVFFINIIVSLFIYTLVYLASPIISNFFDKIIIVELLRIYCLSFIISAFSSVQLAILNRSMSFQHVAMVNLPGTIIGFCIGVYMGYSGYGVWSFVCMSMSTQIFSTILLWLTSDWRPTAILSKKKLKIHLEFGYKLLISNLLDRVFKNLNNIIIGKFFSILTLGLFERAKKFSDYPSSTLTSIISKVSYPLLVSLRDDHEKIASVYRKLLRGTFFVSASLLLGLAAIAEPMFNLVLGQAWIGAYPFFQILCLSAIFYPIHSFSLNLLKVFGKSDLFLRLEIVKILYSIICLLIGLQFGIFGLVWSLVIVSVIGLFINSTYTSELLKYKGIWQFLDIIQVFLLASINGILMYLVVLFLHSYSDILQITVSSSVGVFFFFFFNFMYVKIPIYDLTQKFSNL